MRSRICSHATGALRDHFLWTQLANVLLSIVVPMIAMVYLDDHGIVVSQVIASAGQIAVLAMAIQLSAASLENRDLIWIRARRTALVASVLTWVLIVYLHPEIRKYCGLATAFFLSMLLGEMSAIWRGIVVNGTESRYVLQLNNLVAAAARLLCFFLLLRSLGAFQSFVWSATISNLVRISGIYLAARTVLSNPEGSQAIQRRRVDIFVRLAAFFERNPSSLVVLLLTSLSPVWGMSIRDYALALPLANISIAVASVMWTRFENVTSKSLLRPVTDLTVIASGAALLAVTAIAFIPAAHIGSASILNLKQSPIVLVVGPVLFGFSTGLSVFTYGKSTPLIKVAIIAGAFAFFGELGFMIGLIVNVLYFLWMLRTNLFACGSSEKTEACR